MLIYKVDASLDGNKTIATSLLSLLSQEKAEQSENQLILWEAGQQLPSGAPTRSVKLTCVFLSKGSEGMVG